MIPPVAGPLFVLAAASLAISVAAQEPVLRPEPRIEVEIRGPKTTAQDPVADDRPEPKAILYDVRDLLAPATDSKDVAGVDGWSSEQARLEALVDLLSQFCDPELGPGEQFQMVGSHWFALVGQPEHHAWLTGCLERARRERAAPSDASRVSLRLSHYALDDEQMAALVEDLPALRAPGLEGEDVRYQPVLLSGSDAARELLRGLGTSGGFRIQETTLSLPSLGFGHASVTNQTAYIKDFEVEIQAASAIANPIVDVIRDGFATTAGCVPLEGDQVGLAVHMVVGDLVRPIPVFKTALGVGQEVQIQLPSVSFGRSEATVSLPRGDTLLLVGPEVGKKRVVVAATVAPRDS